MKDQARPQYLETLLRPPPRPEVNVTVPGMDKMASGLSSLSQAISASPQKFREEVYQLVSLVEDRTRSHQIAHNLGFVNGAGLGLTISLILCLAFLRKKHGP